MPQAMDRCHRLGQTRPVTVYRLVTANTIEERIQSTAAAKTHVQKLVMAGKKGAEGAEGAADQEEQELGNEDNLMADEDEDEHVLIPGSIPEGLMLDELEDEETGVLTGVTNAAGDAEDDDGVTTGAYFIDDQPAALGAADVASLLLDDDLAEEAAKVGFNPMDLGNQQQQGLGESMVGLYPSPGSAFGWNPSSHTPGYNSTGYQTPNPGSRGYTAAGGAGFSGKAGVLPGSASPAGSSLAGAAAAGGMTFRKRGGRAPAPGQAAGGSGTGRGRGRRGRPPGSGKASHMHGQHEGGTNRGRGRGRGRGRKKQGDFSGFGDGGGFGWSG